MLAVKNGKKPSLGIPKLELTWIYNTYLYIYWIYNIYL